MIRTNKFFKVYEQSTGDDGFGEVVASFPAAHPGGGYEAAKLEADRLASENPGTRFYVLVSACAVHQDQHGELVRRDY